MTQHFDPYDVNSGFGGYDFEVQVVGHGCNDFRNVSAMLYRNNIRIQYTGDIIWNIPGRFGQ